MPFLNKLTVSEDVLEEEKWVLEEDLVYQGKYDKFVIPKGFVTDFASVPKVFWNLFPPYGKYTKAAVVHDYFYVVQDISRRDADGLFERMMRELGVGWTRRNIMWAAVRAGGRYRDRNVEDHFRQ